MAPPILPSNFKYKALFNYRFLAFTLELSTLESPPLEAVNDFHVGSNSDVVTSSNSYKR
jgi:hypothetical protein